MILKEESGASSWENPKPGVHQAVCIDVEDLGMQQVTYKGETKSKHQLMLRFELAETRSDGGPIRMGRKYSATLDERGALRGDLKSWRGADLTAEEKSELNLEKLVGAQAQVNVEEFQKRDGTAGTAIGAILPPADGQNLEPSGDYVRSKDRKEEDPF